MFCSCPQPNIQRRATAWLLLLVCAWMGTGGVLHHTEAEGSAQPLPKAASSLHHAVAASNDACAACEWTQGLQGLTLAVSPVSLLLCPLPPSLHFSLPTVITPPLRCRPSRAPPVSSAFC